MFCESCGSPVPDGAKFCTECGARISAEPAWTTVPQTAAAPGGDAPVNEGASAIGYSTVSGYAWVPSDEPSAARKPVYKRWWFWLAVVFAAVVIAALLFFALILFSMRNRMPDVPGDIEAVLTETADRTDIDRLPDILTSSADIPDIGEVTALDIDDVFVPMELLTAQIGQTLSEKGLEHDVWADEDGWVYVNVWQDGIDELAAAVYEGDEAALASWQAVTEDLRAMSGDFLADLLAGGQHSAVCVVSLLDDVDTTATIAVAVDGELIFDLATELDEYDLLGE